MQLIITKHRSQRVFNYLVLINKTMADERYILNFQRVMVLIAYQIGSFVLGSSKSHPVTMPPDWDWSRLFASAEAIGQWMIGLGPPLALGVFLLACLLSALGYVVVRALWSMHLRRTWQARRRRALGSQ